MPNPELILALIAALGGGAALPELIRGVAKWANGKQAREHDALRQADADLKAADAQYAAAERGDDRDDQLRVGHAASAPSSGRSAAHGCGAIARRGSRG